MSLEKFAKAYLDAANEANHDLPLILAQWEQGNNPEHAKLLRSIEGTVALMAEDTSAEGLAIVAGLNARAEAMRPKLNWDKGTIARMVSCVKNLGTLDQTSADAVLKSVLKSSGSGISGRGRKPGSISQKVDGASEKVKVTYFNGTVEEFRSNSATSPATIANKVRKTLEGFGQNFSTKALQEVISKVIMGEPEISVGSPDGSVAADITRL